MPKLWDQTIEEHRNHVTEAILHTTVELVTEHGLRAVTMSEIAERAGIGRATLYKYFADVDSILRTWHERQITGHLEQLAEIRDRPGEPGERLAAVLETYALSSYESRAHHDSELATMLHRQDHVTDAQEHLRTMVRGLLQEAVAAGDVRDDITPNELAGYCIHALGAARSLPSKPAVRRLVGVTLDGLRPGA